MKNICLLFGGKSCENDISVITAFSAYSSIFDIYKIYAIYIKNGKFFYCKNMQKIKEFTKNVKKYGKEVYFADGRLIFKDFTKAPVSVFCALNCCHGGSGEDGGLSGLFDLAEIPYTSACVCTSAVFMDKEMTKIVLSSYGYPVLPYKVIRKRDCDDLPGFPCVVKPARTGSSVGISVAHNENEFRASLDTAFSFDDKVLCEPFLCDFTELNCAAYKGKKGIVVSEVEKVTYASNIYDFNAKYKGTDSKRQIPADISPELYEKVREMTKNIYEQTDAKGVIRIDYFLTKTNDLYINEVNTIPGSLAFYLFKNNGGFHRLLTEIIEEGRREFLKKKELIRESDGSFLDSFDFSKLKTGVKK